MELVGGLDLYFELKGIKNNKLELYVFDLSALAALVGIAWPSILVFNVYQCGVIFTIKDLIGIILTLWCILFDLVHME